MVTLGICCGKDRFAAAHAYGFKYVELSISALHDQSEKELQIVKECAQAHNIPIEGFNGFFGPGISLYEDDEDKILSYAKKNLEIAHFLGGQYCVIGSGRARNIPEGMTREGAKERFGSLVFQIGEMAAKLGIVISIEPLQYSETNYINTFRECVDFTRELGHPNVGPMLDFFHFYRNEESIEILQELRPGELRHVHLARPNPDRKYPQEEDIPVLETWAAALNKSGYDGRLSLECGWPEDYENALQEAFKNMQMFL